MPELKQFGDLSPAEFDRISRPAVPIHRCDRDGRITSGCADFARAAIGMASRTRSKLSQPEAPGQWPGLLVAAGLSTWGETRRSAMGAAGLRIRKRRLHRMPRAEA